MPNLRLIPKIEDGVVVSGQSKLNLIQNELIEFSFGQTSAKLTLDAAQDFLFDLAQLISEIESRAQ